MTRVPYERSFLRDWIRRVAEAPVDRSEALGRPPQTTYERTFRWHLGAGDRPNLFLFRRGTSGVSPDGRDTMLTPFDAVLIDGQHNYEWARHDLAERGACVRPGGVILVHRTRGGFDRALSALHAWAADASLSLRWPHHSSLEVAKVFEDLRAAAHDEGARPGLLNELRDLREDFEHEAANDGLLACHMPIEQGLAKAAG